MGCNPTVYEGGILRVQSHTFREMITAPQFSDVLIQKPQRARLEPELLIYLWPQQSIRVHPQSKFFRVFCGVHG